MKAKTMKNIIKGIAITQAIAAPVLMVAGVVTNNQTMKIVGMVWCGLVVLDGARVSCGYIDALYKEVGLENENKL